MKVLVVDDSLMFRNVLKMVVEMAPGVSEIAAAKNGLEAVEMLAQGGFDLAIFDLEMPVMDGLSAIKKVREQNTTLAILVFSTQTSRAADKTFKALEYGANDFVQKTVGETLEENIGLVKQELLPKIQAFKERGESKEITGRALLEKSRGLRVVPKERADLIFIGSSTGGPEALKGIFSKLPSDLRAPILIVQHMPPLFTTQFALSLSKVSAIEVIEAKGGEILCPGKAYLAPGNYHMTIERVKEGHRIGLNQEEKICFCRPAFDALCFSASKIDGPKIASFVLTGMGSDGLEGTKALKKRGGSVFIQDKESATVWGMGGAIFESGHHDDIIYLDEIARCISEVGGGAA